MQAGGRRFDPVILDQNPEINVGLSLAFERSIATFFNKMEEGCVAALMRRWQHVVIASVLVLQLGQDSTNELPVAAL